VSHVPIAGVALANIVTYINNNIFFRSNERFD
jgi:hypothetical protein